MNPAIDWRSRPVPVIAGLGDTRKRGGQPYRTRPLGDILAGTVPQTLPKERALAFLPSLYFDSDARSHAAQREHGRFVALVGDIDHGDCPLDLVASTVAAVAGDAAWSIYSTASAKPDDRRWRVVVPLSEPSGYDDWHDAQLALVAILQDRGLELDTSAARPGQISFLPNVPAELRRADGQPLFFEQRSNNSATGFCIRSGDMADAIAVIRAKRADDDAARERIRAEAFERRACRPISSGSGSMIDAFNRDNDVPVLLASYNYRQSPRHGEDWRSPMQTSESFATRVIEGDKWISLSGSDAASGLGERCSAGCFGDAFDLFCHFEHGGDRKAALRQLHRERETVESYTGFNPETGEELGDEAGGEDDASPKRAGVNLADFRAYMPQHSYIFAPTGELWPATSVNSRIPPLVANESGGKAQEIKASAWLDQNRPVEQMTWIPGKPQVVADKLVSDGGWLDRPGCNVFNLYRPPIDRGGDEAQAGPWLDHVRRVYPDDAEHLVRWFAQRVQRPWDKINHALVLGGSQGIGKDTILEPVKEAIGAWNFAEVSPQHLLGRFNGFVKSVILRVSEARDLGEVDRFAFYDHMKTYTAAPPDVLRVDEKHLREYAVFNVCGVIITSNHKTDGIYLPPDDRRHYVAWSPVNRDSFEPDYWQRLYAWFGNGGLGHVAAFLRGFDLSDFDAKAPPPHTPAFWDIVSANKSPEDAELADALEALAWPSAVTVAAIVSMAQPTFADFLTDRRNSRRIPHRLEQCGYVPVRNDAATDGLFKVGGKRCVIYARHNLPLRDQIAAAQTLIRR